MEWLKNKRTYIIAIVAGVATTVKYLGWIDEHVYLFIMGLLGSGAAITMRSAISKVQSNQEAIKRQLK